MPKDASLLISRKIMTLANVLKRAATLRYRELLQLNQGEWGIIAELGTRQPCNLVDLSAGLGLDKSQLSRSVSNLVDRGLVQRRVNPGNNREILLSLSAAGQASYDRLIASGLAVNDELLAGVTAAQRLLLGEQLDLLMVRAADVLRREQTKNTHDESEGGGLRAAIDRAASCQRTHVCPSGRRAAGDSQETLISAPSPCARQRSRPCSALLWVGRGR